VPKPLRSPLLCHNCCSDRSSDQGSVRSPADSASLAGLRKKCSLRRNLTAAAKADAEKTPVIAAVNRCAAISSFSAPCWSLALHLQLHLRVLLENLRVSLPQQLCDPLVGNAAGTEPRRVGGTQVVDAEIRNASKYRDRSASIASIHRCGVRSGMPLWRCVGKVFSEREWQFACNYSVSRRTSPNFRKS